MSKIDSWLSGWWFVTPQCSVCALWTSFILCNNFHSTCTQISTNLTFFGQNRSSFWNLLAWLSRFFVFSIQVPTKVYNWTDFLLNFSRFGNAKRFYCRYAKAVYIFPINSSSRDYCGHFSHLQWIGRICFLARPLAESFGQYCIDVGIDQNRWL